jgi:cellulose synthase/poly-beta-1,6-N-acetylglucosamine synthase-like glycosyltransferase
MAKQIFPDSNPALDARSDWAVNGLRRNSPELSATPTTWAWQRWSAAALVAVLAVGFWRAPRLTGLVLVILLLIVYLATLTLRLVLIRWSLAPGEDVSRVERDALAVDPVHLPRYTVLVPAYREPEVMPQLIASLDALDYPIDKLEILLLLEEGDHETIAAAEALHNPVTMEIIIVPPSQPQTKPKALNYALQQATGDLVTIYDAEDRPEPLQLRKAALALERGGPRMACVQAQLNFYNPGQNIITRWFTLDYTMWFQQFLPGLVRLDAPIPLGGTSNHMRRDVLIEVGGWDAFNVTEDADLGIRLARAGYTVGVVESVTLEEANSDVINWVKQRSRWYKGYLQTWLVHMRRPRQLRQQLGNRGFLIFNLFIGGTPLLAVLNPVFWGLAVAWYTIAPPFIKALYPAFVLYAGNVSWVVGNFLLIYSFVLTAVANHGTPKLIRSALLVPVYFVLMSMAAYKALLQLISAPSFWEKTVHGLDEKVPAP